MMEPRIRAFFAATTALNCADAIAKPTIIAAYTSDTGSEWISNEEAD